MTCLRAHHSNRQFVGFPFNAVYPRILHPPFPRAAADIALPECATETSKPRRITRYLFFDCGEFICLIVCCKNMKTMEKVVAGVILPVIVGVAVLWLTHLPRAVVPSVAPAGWVAIMALLLAAGMVSAGMGAIAVIQGDFPAPALVLIGLAAIGSALGAAIVSEANNRPLPPTILLALSGILMLAFGIGCHFRNLLFGTYSGLLAALCATVLVIFW